MEDNVEELHLSLGLVLQQAFRAIPINLLKIKTHLDTIIEILCMVQSSSPHLMTKGLIYSSFTDSVLTKFFSIWHQIPSTSIFVIEQL